MSNQTDEAPGVSASERARDWAELQVAGLREQSSSKYRKKPVEIEARQWDGTAPGATPIINWILAGGGTGVFYCDEAGCERDTHVLSIHTLEGRMWASPGDWIIQGVQGEFYPCKPDIFEQTYEPVREQS